MSDNIPFDIQVDILKRLPVKSIIQFRSVSKAWKSLIDSSGFIARYSAQQTQPQHLLVCENASIDLYGTFADDDTFPQHRVSLTKTPLLNSLTNQWVYYSHGVLCFYSDCHEGHDGHKPPLTSMAVLWNPWIKKAVGVIVPEVRTAMYGTHVSFGVCRETIEPKLVKVTYILSHMERQMESVSCIPWKFEVFTFSTGAWRSPYRNLPRNSVRFNFRHQVTVDGFIYWIATDKSTVYRGDDLLISFDITTEEFGEVNLRERLALAKNTYHYMSISKLRNSLVVLDYDLDVNNLVHDVWMIEDGVFTKLFSVHVNSQFSFISGFRKSGAPIVDSRGFGRSELVVYEPNYTDPFCINQIRSETSVVNVYNYTESLLLLDQPDLKIFNVI